MSYKVLSELDVAGKRVLTRLDLNTPISDGKVSDDTRIDAALPTIQYILQKKGIAILMSHLGRPKGEVNPKYSLKPVAERLSEKLGKDVVLAPDCVGEETEKIVGSALPGSIVLLENLRFHQAEEDNGQDFVVSLAKHADIYLNDAFGTAHRAHASTYGVPLYLREQKKTVGVGLLMGQELNVWKPIVEGSENRVAIIGGAKLKEKVNAVKNLAKNFDHIILGGVVANVFMRASGIDIKESKYLEKDKDYTQDAKEVLASYSDTIILPKHIAYGSKDLQSKGEGSPKELAEGLVSADVIPASEDLDLIRNAKQVVWFGPLGAYEYGFTKGTESVVQAINGSSAYTVIGGGDVAAASKGVKAHISTGGGASIVYITKKTLPALEALSG